jgi:hypothetical protein
MRIFVQKKNQQIEYEQKYPFLKISVQRQQYGDAGSTLGHIQILEQACSSFG